MGKFASGPDEIFRTGNRKVYIWLVELEDGRWAVDYEARPLVISRALDAPPPPRRRCVVEASREAALEKAKERFRQMYDMRKLATVNPRQLVFH